MIHTVFRQELRAGKVIQRQGNTALRPGEQTLETYFGHLGKRLNVRDPQLLNL